MPRYFSSFAVCGNTAGVAWPVWRGSSRARQQEAELRRETARFEEHRKIALASIEQRLVPLIERRVSIEAELHGVRLQQAKLTSFWNLLARRRCEHAQVVLDQRWPASSHRSSAMKKPGMKSSGSR
jgi:hypothetical protein